MHLPALAVGASERICGFGCFSVARASLMENGKSRHGVEQRGYDLRQESVEEPRALRSAEDEQMRPACGPREREELRPHGNAGDLSIAEPARCRRKVDRCGLYALAHQAIGEAGHG